MNGDDDPPLKLVAPWRWHWGLIWSLVWRLGAAALAAYLLLMWSAVFGPIIALGIWMGICVWCTEPHSPTGEGPPLEDEEAGQGLVFIQDPDQPNRWRITHSEQRDEMGAAGPDVLRSVRDAPRGTSVPDSGLTPESHDCHPEDPY